jgi:hypothetical protein
VFFLKRDHADIDRSFVIYTFLGLLVVFLNPGAPQYILPMIPFLIMMAFCVDQRFRVPTFLLMVFASLYMLAPVAMDFSSMTVYTDLLSLDSFKAIYGIFDFELAGINGFDVWNYTGNILQCTGVILTAIVTLIWLRGDRTHSGQY